MEAVLLAAASCSAMDVVDILEKMRQPLERLEVDVEADRAEEAPKVFTRMHLSFRARGDGVEEAALERAIRLSREKYCSVLLMLQRGGVEVSTSFVKE